ncbi:hypothetical protein PR048_004894 [Dryococelus australis]|uniref:Uncharacterized protein n=1 Tax=Dryococelus australis TaxID=614101 RepID=A0ABQ9I7R3_9NEOP|nr:hypothetical protein PR048_004894 [Dryococelus australis]
MNDIRELTNILRDTHFTELITHLRPYFGPTRAAKTLADKDWEGFQKDLIDEIEIPRGINVELELNVQVKLFTDTNYHIARERWPGACVWAADFLPRPQKKNRQACVGRAGMPTAPPKLGQLCGFSGKETCPTSTRESGLVALALAQGIVFIWALTRARCPRNHSYTAPRRLPNDLSQCRGAFCLYKQPVSYGSLGSRSRHTQAIRWRMKPMRMKRVEYGAAPKCEGKRNGRSPRKLADQRHRPSRFPYEKIQGRDRRESNPVRNDLIVKKQQPTCGIHRHSRSGMHPQMHVAHMMNDDCGMICLAKPELLISQPQADHFWMYCRLMSGKPRVAHKSTTSGPLILDELLADVWQNKSCPRQSEPAISELWELWDVILPPHESKDHSSASVCSCLVDTTSGCCSEGRGLETLVKPVSLSGSETVVS